MQEEMNVQTLEDVEKGYTIRQYVPPPPPILNGGLYTGEPFQKDAPWANVPVIADADYMTNINLRSANPPPQALYQYPGNTRPGNNYQANTGLKPYRGDNGFEDATYNFNCIPCNTFKEKTPDCPCKRMYPISGNCTLSSCNCKDVVYVRV